MRDKVAHDAASCCDETLLLQQEGHLSVCRT